MWVFWFEHLFLVPDVVEGTRVTCLQLMRPWVYKARRAETVTFSVGESCSILLSAFAFLSSVMKLCVTRLVVSFKASLLSFSWKAKMRRKWVNWDPLEHWKQTQNKNVAQGRNCEEEITTASQCLPWLLQGWHRVSYPRMQIPSAFGKCIS